MFIPDDDDDLEMEAARALAGVGKDPSMVAAVDKLIEDRRCLQKRLEALGPLLGIAEGATQITEELKLEGERVQTQVAEWGKRVQKAVAAFKSKGNP